MSGEPIFEKNDIEMHFIKYCQNFRRTSRECHNAKVNFECVQDDLGTFLQIGTNEETLKFVHIW